MNRYSEVALGKCSKCGDQLLSIPPREPDTGRRVICPICTTNNLEDMISRQGTVVLSREEAERCSE